MARVDLDAVLGASRSPDAEERRLAVRELCGCRIKANHIEAWDRVIELTADPHIDVRKNAFHVLIDGSPRERHDEVVAALERLRVDPDPKLRRNVRRALARYRRTGQVNLNHH
jgi:HEAT repeat protein